MKWRAFVVVLSALLVTGALAKHKKETIIEAQSLPITKTLVWDANPASDAVINYTVTLDGATVGNPVGTSQPVTFTTLGAHVLGVTATNLFGTSPMSTLTVNVIIPGSPKNPKIQ